MTRKELIDSLKAAAEPVYGEREAAAIARLVAEKRYGLTRAECALDPDVEVEPGEGFAELLAEIAAARPVQYILGTADFDGMELAVGEGVLIPRPETEELVRWIVDDALEKFAREHTEPYVTEQNFENKEAESCFSRKILDIGTGSGAIAIALAKRLPQACLTAVDISPEALGYARRNNERTGAGVTLLDADILEPGLDLQRGPYDIIVSNPPYIPAAERGQMARNVTEYEPATALFVPDGDPLLFYRAIARFARRYLAPWGALYFEIHESAAETLPELLRTEGFREVELRDDINSKPRMIRGCLNFATEDISGFGREVFSHGEGGAGVPAAREQGEKSTGSEAERPRMANSKQPLKARL